MALAAPAHVFAPSVSRPPHRFSLRAVTACAALTLVTSCHSPRNDLDSLCGTAKEVLANKSIESPFKIMEIEKRFMAEGHSRAARECVKGALGAVGVAPSYKYAAFEACARKQNPEWTCAPLRDFMTAPAVPVRGGDQ
jgi:hypothetical protein